MDPITISVIVGVSAVALSGILGRAVGIRTGRKREQAHLNAIDLVAENEALKEQNESLQRDNNWFNGHYESLKRDLRQVTADRDKYRTMAESHEVKIPKTPAPETATRKVWKEKRFGGHPRDNLVNLAKEMEPYKDLEVEMDIRIIGSEFGGGHGHAQALSEAWKNGGRPIKDIGPFRYHGPGKRALADFSTFLTDDNTGLMKRVKDGSKVWRDDDSPLCMVVALTVTETITPKVPEVHVVEVAIVEKTVERVVVEKPVVVLKETPAATPADLRQVVEEVLARREAEAEVEKLDRESVEERVRKLQARQGVRTQG